MAVEGLLTVLVLAWFAVHVGFPRGSQPSRVGGLLLAATFLQLVVYVAITTGAQV